MPAAVHERARFCDRKQSSPERIATTAFEDSSARRASASSNGWGWVLAYALAVIVLSIFALANPLTTGLATGFLLGVTLTAYGILAIVAALSSRHVAGWTIAFGALATLAGILTLFDPFGGALSIVWLIGFWFLVAGVFQLTVASRSASDRTWHVLLGVLDLVLAVAILCAGPLTALSFLAVAVGISLVFRGVFLLTLALGLNRLVHG
ncbi:HdeD family acid-resistance protein [Sphingomonas abietis]|uniref:DUF308 domain-containing protein n=1 Tax=Sphingomonas abietis TaxID=3012344 RepID=A0ABY7NT25_9SPHN|nr:DUF308 domain-containing protein [Sphingomonas abietis]WBO24287.1 DUF308 domain-containing protein [Sphingomonas abietis]